MGNLGPLSFSARIQEEAHTKIFQIRNKKWTGWKPTTEDQSLRFKKEVMKKKVVHRTKSQRQKEIMSIPEN